MNIKTPSMILGLEIVMVAGIVLAGMAVAGVFEPKFSCNIARSAETLVATGAALAMVFGSCIGVHRLNKSLKANVTAEAAQNLPAAADLA